MAELKSEPKKMTIEDLGVKVDSLAVTVGGLATKVDDLTVTVDGLTNRVDGLAENMDNLAAMTQRQFSAIQDDLSVIREDISNCATKDDLSHLRTEMKIESGKLNERIDSVVGILKNHDRRISTIAATYQRI